VRVSFLAPHLRIAGGVRAILTYADRLAARGHDVTLVVPAKGRMRAAWRSLRGQRPDWFPGLRARVDWVADWNAARLPDADVLVATAWQSAPVVADAPRSKGAKWYLVQHYESLYHGRPDTVDATYRLPLSKIVISTWLADVMRERFATEAEVIVTPVDRDLFHRVTRVVRAPVPRVLMLHHAYAWKGVADGLTAVDTVRAQGVSLQLVGFGVKPPDAPVPYDEFHGNPAQTALAALYSGCDVYLCPSWDEGLGMPSMEAMACGAALVTRDYARDGETALVARRREVDDLAQKLTQMLGDAVLRVTIAERGARFIREAFDWDRAVSRMEALFGAASSRTRP
jgi:glycosyltransferase involved in cell wall biosynthesis